MTIIIEHWNSFIIFVIVIEDYLVSLIYLIILVLITMANINKKQASLAVVAVVFATALFVSVIASDNAFARDKSVKQSISQSCHQHQKSQVVTAGANSPVRNSGNNVGLCVNLNGGGNAAAQ